MRRLVSKVEMWLKIGLSLLNTASQKEVFPRLVLLGIIALFCFNIYPALLTRFDYSALEQRYKNWMADPGNVEWFISDSDIYAYAGGRYVRGASPDEINFEHPPLAKYMIGLSELLFNNPNVLSGALGVFSLLILYEISKRLLGSPLFALIPVYILSLERIFILFSSVSMLDIYLVFFLLLSILLFADADSDAKLLLGGVIVGLGTACKLTAPLAIPSLFIAVIARRKKKAWKGLIQCILVALLAYCSTYAWFFVLGHDVPDFLGLQWKMLMFQFGTRYGVGYPPGRLLLTLLTGIVGPETRKIFYVDEISRSITVVTMHGLMMEPAYNPLTWPLCLSAAIMSFYESIKTRNMALLQQCVFIFSFLVPFSVAMGFVWYLLPVLPIGFLLLTNVLAKTSEGSSRRTLLPPLFFYLLLLLVWLNLLSFPSFVRLWAE